MPAITEMTYRFLGRTDLNVSRVTLGGGGPSRLGLTQAGGAENVDRLVKQAVDLGINLIDTAPGYGTEESIGQALESVTERVYIATKVWCYSTPDVTNPHQPPLTDPHHLIESVEKSLKALRRDRIDLLQLHGVPGPAVESMTEHFLPAMQQLQKEGKIRHIGITEHPGIDPDQDMAIKVCHSELFDTLMIQYGIFDQLAQHRTFELASRHKIGVLCMCAARAAFTNPQALRTRLSRILPEKNYSLDFLLQGSVHSYADAAFQFAAARKEIDTIVVGTSRVDHLIQSSRAILGDSLPQTHTLKLEQDFGHTKGEELWND